MNRRSALMSPIRGVILAGIASAALLGCGDGDEDGDGSGSESEVATVDATAFERCMNKGKFKVRSGDDFFTDAEGHSSEAESLRDEATQVLVATNVEVRYRAKSPILNNPAPQALILFLDSPPETLLDDVPGDFIADSAANVVWIFGGSSLLPVEATKDTRAFSSAATACATG
ncbi:MAG TPA: hypothetical protein VFY99_05140 [Solirubrobacterales bacterium]